MKLFSPVLAKELVTMARRRRTYFTRALLLSVLLLFIAMSWLTMQQVVRYSGFADSSIVGRNLFNAFAMIQLAAVAVLVPAMTAPVVAAEKDRNTLSLLLMSHLRPRNILLDKLLSRLLVMFLLLAAGLPIFISLLSFGGVTPGQIARAFVEIVATMFLCGAVGLYCSTVAARMHTALIMTYAALAGYVFGLLWLFEECGTARSLADALLPFDLMRVDAAETAAFASVSLAAFALSLLVATRLLPRQAERPRRHVLKRLLDALTAFYSRINFTGVTFVGDRSGPAGNAILWKESHQHFFSSNAFLVRACYALLMLSMVVFMLVRRWEVAGAIVTVGGLIFLAAIAIVASSVAFTAEREKHTLDALLAAPLGAREIVTAKFLGVLKLALPILLTMLIWSALAGAIEGYAHGYYRRYRWPGLGGQLRLALVVAAYLPALITIGLRASARRRRSGSAILQTFLVTTAWCLAPLVPAILHQYRRVIGFDLGFGHRLFEKWLSATPFGAVVLVFDDDLHVAWCAAVIPAWMLLLGGLVRRFDKLAGRA